MYCTRHGHFQAPTFSSELEPEIAALVLRTPLSNRTQDTVAKFDHPTWSVSKVEFSLFHFGTVIQIHNLMCNKRKEVHFQKKKKRLVTKPTSNLLTSFA